MVSSLLIGAGILAFVSSYVLFKLAERGRDKEFESHNALQILMFFLLISSLFLVGKASYDDRNHCDLLITDFNEVSLTSGDTVNTTTINNYDYVCVDNNTSTGKWLYKIPLFIIQIAGIYLIIYLLKMLYNAFNKSVGDQRNNER